MVTREFKSSTKPEIKNRRCHAEGGRGPNLRPTPGGLAWLMTDEQLGSVERSEVMAVIGRGLWSPLRSEALRIKGERMSWVLAIPALSVPGLGALLVETPLHPLATRQLGLEVARPQPH